jgi:hypothetical protein
MNARLNYARLPISWQLQDDQELGEAVQDDQKVGNTVEDDQEVVNIP